MFFINSIMCGGFPLPLGFLKRVPLYITHDLGLICSGLRWAEISEQVWAASACRRRFRARQNKSLKGPM